MDGVVRATDLLIAGLNVVVVGFGDCGKELQREPTVWEQKLLLLNQTQYVH